MQQKMNKSLCIWVIFVCFSCKNTPALEQTILISDTITSDEIVAPDLNPIVKKKPEYDTALWADIAILIPDIVQDIKYATEENFTKKQIYDCPRCLLRKDAALALKNAFELVYQAGYGLKVFDCYRPAPYQQRLWDVMPDKRYVAPPWKGSMHSRGGAVDLTLIYLDSKKEVNMGTPYDFFGKEAHPAYKSLPDSTLQHRKLLTQCMTDAGFRPITSEWWHFDFGSSQAKLEDFLWECE